MGLSIKNARAERLVDQVVTATGESKTQAIVTALEERLERLTARRAVPSVRGAIMDISRRARALPRLDRRRPDKILGYNKAGTFE